MKDMSQVFKRSIPMVLTTVLAVSLILVYFFDFGAAGESLGKILLNFAVVIGSASLGLGIVNLTSLHVRHIRRRTLGQWYYSIFLIVSMIFMIVVGLIYTVKSDEYSLMYDATVAPLGSTMMSLFIVWIAPALYRSVRIRNLGSGLLILCMCLVIFGGSPLGPSFWAGSTDVSSWLNSVINLASMRGLKITIAIGLIILSIRILTGKEKSYLRAGGS